MKKYVIPGNPVEPATILMLKMMQFSFLSTFYEHPIQLQAPCTPGVTTADFVSTCYSITATFFCETPLLISANETALRNVVSLRSCNIILCHFIHTLLVLMQSLVCEWVVTLGFPSVMYPYSSCVILWMTQ